MPSFWASVEGEIESACQVLVPFYLSFMERACLPNVAEVPISEMQVSQRLGHGFLEACIWVPQLHKTLSRWCHCEVVTVRCVLLEFRVASCSTCLYGSRQGPSIALRDDPRLQEGFRFVCSHVWDASSSILPEHGHPRFLHFWLQCVPFC